MRDMEYLQLKRLEVLNRIRPICEAFQITDYDYELKDTGRIEILRIEDTRIACSMNSISAIVNELIGYIFIKIWCHDRSLGAFEAQTKKIITQYWVGRE